MWYFVAALAGILLLPILFWGICALAVDPGKEYTCHNRLYRFALNSGTVVALAVGRIRLHISGLEKIPKDTKKLLFVSNHRSNYDPIVTWWVLRKWTPAFVSKASNFKIPIFGRIVRRCCFLAIDREDPRKAMYTIQKAAKLLESGQLSVGIYPEGTRSKSGEMLPFHNGVFKIAQRSGAQVVVLALRGTEQVHKNLPLRHTDVYLDVLDVIGGEEAACVRSGVLGEKVYAMLDAFLTEETQIKETVK